MTHSVGPTEVHTRPWPPVAWSYATAAAVVATGLAGIVGRSRVYGGETLVLADAAIAQDVVTVLLAGPALLVAARRASAGSVAATLVALGVMSFLAYNYAIYCFSITFGPLFLPWTVLRGTSTFLLLAGLWQAHRQRHGRWVSPRMLVSVPLCVVAATFAALWLLQIGRDTLDGSGSASAGEWDVPTNPVHVLDLAFFLPAAFAAGWFLRSGRQWALVLAPVMLAFFVLTSVPIIVTPVVAAVRGHDATWGAAGPVTVIAVVSAVALARALSPATDQGLSSTGT